MCSKLVCEFIDDAARRVFIRTISKITNVFLETIKSKGMKFSKPYFIYIYIIKDKYSCSEVAAHEPAMNDNHAFLRDKLYQIRSNSNNNNNIVIDFGKFRLHTFCYYLLVGVYL